MSITEIFYNNYMILCCIMFILVVNHFFKQNIKNFLLFLLVVCLMCLASSWIETNRLFYYVDKDEDTDEDTDEDEDTYEDKNNIGYYDVYGNNNIL